MSALLPISERVFELNLGAEHGYTYRNFKRVVRVFQSSDYKSALFLVYATHRHTLPNRKTPYRNHFTLYRSDDTVVVVRSETTLRFQDHDAALMYDVVKPTESYRAATEFDWTVSFDKIRYSNARPNFLGHTLVCSGEWWYFENGVILNGVTAYEKGAACGHMFIYYELHPKYNIVTTTKSARLGAQTRLLALAGASTSLPSSVRRRPPQPPPPPHRTPLGTIGRDVSGRSGTPRSLAADDSVGSSGGGGGTGGGGGSAESTSSSRSGLFVDVVQASTFDSRLAPIVNTLARPLIQTNDEQEVPDLDTKTVVPSMYWFTQRRAELEAKCIAYFLPKDFVATATTGGGGGILDDVYYNLGLPAVPLPVLVAETPAEETWPKI